ncbi:TRAP transporter large permease [Intestinimonas butyriciproducens]|uniref:TRAP transporter large permease n=1 Tax=Intestinimonas butyriciproducens TaxID=1297617 RepID=UPI0034E54B5D
MIVVILFFLLLLIGVPVGFVVLTSAISGILTYTSTPALIIVQQMFAGLDNFVILAIPFFVIAGNLAAHGKTSEHLVNAMTVIFGRLKGGTAIATIATCAFFAAISGSGIATVVAVGSLMIPGLIKQGYPREMAAGIVGSAGTIGTLIPPSAPMILICVAMNTSVGKQFMAGFLPGILLAVCWCVYVWFVSKKHGYGESTKYTGKEAARVFLHAVPALMFPVIVLGSIYTGWATPTEAAAISVVYIILIELFVYKTLKIREIPKIFFDSLVTSATLAIILSCAQVLTWLVTMKQIPAMLAGIITTLVSNKVAFILLLTVVFLIAGCFMDLVALVVVLAPVLAPALAFYGIDPIHFGIMAVMNAQLGCLTPPFGVNLYVTMNVSKLPLTQVVKGVLPYMLILLAVTLVISFVPEISLFLPRVLG